MATVCASGTGIDIDAKTGNVRGAGAAPSRRNAEFVELVTVGMVGLV